MMDNYLLIEAEWIVACEEAKICIEAIESYINGDHQ